MKKLFCIVLALAMMLSFGSMAAAETTAEAVKGTTLFNCDENGIPDLGGLKIWLPMDSDYASFASSYNDFAIVKEMEKLMNVNLEFICPSADDVATSFSLMISDPSDLPDIIMKGAVDSYYPGGVAMAYAGVSRPASGVEHYFSHVWDMRALEFGTPAELHGIQCAIGTLAAVRLYEKLRTMTPDAEKARAYVEAFDYEAWAAQLRAFLGRSGETMIALEKKEGKYRKDTHPARFARIQACWPEILRILDEELPSAEALSQLLSRLGMPQDASVIGVDTETMRLSFRATKDIRDKYVLSRLAWDLGVLDELCALL